MHLCTFSLAFNNPLKTFRSDKTSLNDFLGYERTFQWAM